MFRCNARTAAGCNSSAPAASKVVVVERGPMLCELLGRSVVLVVDDTVAVEE